MSISNALSNALSGLTVTSRAADVVASNVANAMTDGYGVREVDIASRVIGAEGGGARVTGITRHEDAAVTGARRHADADVANHGIKAGFRTNLETLIGTPDQPGSLTARAAALEASLTSAASNPQSQAHLTGVVDAAVALAGQVNAISDGIQAERLRADTGIARAVAHVNGALLDLDALNSRIRQEKGGARDISSLLDAQSVLVDQIAPYIPLETRRDSVGALQVYSSDGQVLLDRRASELSFSPVSVMTADLSVDTGGLGELSLNGRPVIMGGVQPSLTGGTLSALFDLRDTGGPAAQAQIDAVALDLTSRFDAVGLDPTLAPGAPGLFTDAGSAASALDEVGLAGRLRVNSAVLPSEGGAVWRIRDGLGAAVEGPVGNGAFLTAQIDALATRQPTASGGFSATDRSFAGLVSDHLSLAGFARQSAEADQGRAAALQTSLLQQELSRGVDTDAEMRKILLIEQAYAANARVVNAVEDMLDDLLRIA